jgi:hypothetical protein
VCMFTASTMGDGDVGWWMLAGGCWLVDVGWWMDGRLTEEARQQHESEWTRSPRAAWVRSVRGQYQPSTAE